jgi:hypothetical protein
VACDLLSLVAEYGLDPARRGLACALNDEVVPVRHGGKPR